MEKVEHDSAAKPPPPSVAGPLDCAGCWTGSSVTAGLEVNPVPPCLFPSQVVSRGAIYAVLLKILPLPVAQLLTKCGLLTRFSPFLRASTQSLAEVLRQLPASPELQAVLSYIFPTYGGSWPWALGSPCLLVFLPELGLFSRSVMSDSLRPHGLQHARLPCPSLSPGVCSNSCALSQ